MSSFTADQTFEKQSFTEKPLSKGEYDNCMFNHCDMSNSNLSEIRFIDCVFTGCNLSMTHMSKTMFRDVAFRECKMLGLRLDTCDPFGLSFSFEQCVLNHSSFYQLKLKKTVFKKTELKEVDFTACDLSSAVFDQCDLFNALFDQTILEKADLRSSFHYSIDPENNKIKKAKFSLDGLPGLLNKYDIQVM